MSQLDVSELFTDPDFVDKLIIVKQKTHVDDLGQNQIREFSYPSVGSVQPASGKTLQRLPEALRIAGVNSFWIKKIIADGCTQYPNVIIFNGDRYKVQIIFDWTNWGEGYCEGTAVREKPFNEC